jgi:hypothetical protein
VSEAFMQNIDLKITTIIIILGGIDLRFNSILFASILMILHNVLFISGKHLIFPE